MKIFEDNIFNISGESGKAWLLQLPQLVEKISIKWNLSDLKPVENLSYNYILSGFQDKQPIILKISPDIEGLNREAAALTSFFGYGAVRISAQTSDALLLQQVVPGHSLKSYFPDRDKEAIQITCEIIKKLHQAPLPEKGMFPHINEWLSLIDNYSQFTKAKILKDRLLETATTPVLLHGDLHHDNILQNINEWLVIDPKGVIGESAYEVASFIRNPLNLFQLQGDQLYNLIQNRIADFANILDLDARRIQDWCFVQAALSWIWALEDGNDPKHFVSLLELFEKIHK